MRRVTSVLLVTPLLLGGMPANAAGGRVTVSYIQRHVMHGTGYIVEAVCEATADPGLSGDVALLTSVTCEINGARETQALAGSKAVSHMTAAARSSIQVCHSATATFFDPRASAYSASSPRTCITVR